MRNIWHLLSTLPPNPPFQNLVNHICYLFVVSLSLSLAASLFSLGDEGLSLTPSCMRAFLVATITSSLP